MRMELIKLLAIRRPGWVIAVWLVVAGVGGRAVARPDAAGGRGAGARCWRAAPRAAAPPSWSVSAGPTSRTSRWSWRCCTGRRPDRGGPAVRRAIGPAVRGDRAARGGAPRARARLGARDRPSGWSARTARSSWSPMSLASSFVAPVTHEAVAWLQSAGRRGGRRHPGGPGGPLDRRRGDRPRLHGRRPDLARPRRRGDGRPAADRPAGASIARSGWRWSRW